MVLNKKKKRKEGRKEERKGLERWLSQLRELAVLIED